ncbi:MAG: leucine-rich repeat domain-containing protein [Candidatus Omnitrophota bacterium]|jgi:Leucine-rich repeat (LRR) protein|nr:MAG: leucine-rich repeat domain-containing protein [Candidatus Omnitrophota bacterium]
MKSHPIFSLILVVFIFSKGVNGQNINTPENFPDPNFRAAVEEFMGVEAGGEFTSAQAASHHGWFDQCQGRGIRDLSGIEYLTGISALYCGDNQLTELDISRNTALAYLSCINNQISRLDVSNNTALISIQCWRNQLTELDVTFLPALQYLYCDGNQLSVLDLSNNPNLTSLYCSGNRLSALDISHNPKLQILHCQENQITAIDLSLNPALTEIDLDVNQLTNLDVSTNTALQRLHCRNNPLVHLDLTHNTKLTQLYCRDNQFSQIDLSHQPLLTHLECTGNPLASLDISANPALEYLRCNENQLVSLNMTNNPVLNWLDCGGNQLTALNVSGNKALTYLDCRDNPLGALDLSQNTALTILYCIDAQLTSLDVSTNTKLEQLYCWSNQLASLDLSNNPTLSILNCSLNQLKTLDVSKNSALRYLNCYENQLTDVKTFIENAGLSGDDAVDIRNNDLSFDDWPDVLTLRHRLQEPTFYSWGEIETGFAYSPQKGFDPYDFSDMTPTPTFTFTPAPTYTPVPTHASPTPTSPATPTPLPPTATPTPPTQQLVVYDNSSDESGDLSGQTDYDTVDNRNLSIAWNAPQWNATNWHVYVRKGFGGSKYLGQTGNGGIFRLNWSPNASNLAAEFVGGPDFNSFYTFRVIRIDGSLDSFDYIDMASPVGYNLAGGNPVSLSQPEMPNLNVGQIVIYDDILGGDDLAPMGSTGVDVDAADSRAIQIAWNFGVDVSTVNEYHVLVKVDGGEYQFLGQTYNGNITYFWWTPNNEFRTADSFAGGPQNGHSYQFMVILRPLSGVTRNLVSGVLHYTVSSGETSASQSQTVFIY